MFDSLYATETDRALTLRTQAPPPPPAGVGVFDGFWRAVSTAPAAAVLDMATAADRATGSRQVMDLRMQAERGALPRLDRGAQSQRQVLEQFAPIAPPFRLRSPMEDAIRESLTPDPITTGAASQAAFGIVNLLTKAAVFGGPGGAGFGAAATGLVEGATESQKLQGQGVDSNTALAAGAVRALSTGVGLAAPVAGSTLLRSFGIVAATGPGTFVAEQAAIKTILERADYGKQAEQYDPTDLNGLIISTLAPAGFAAVVHGARAGRARSVTATAEPATATAARTAPPEAVDAAHTLNLKQTVEQSAPVRNQADPEARQRHLAAVDQTEAQINRGEAVQPAAAADPAIATRVEQAMAERVNVDRAEVRFPRVDELGTVMVGGTRLTPRVIAEGAPLYRETNVDGLNDLLRLDLYENTSRTFVADNPDIAIGQGNNRGVQVEFRPNSLSGEQNVKPAPDSAGREFVTDIIAPRAVQSVTLPANATGLRGLTKRVLEREFSAETLPDGRVRYTRRAEPARPAGEAAPQRTRAAAPKASDTPTAAAPVARPEGSAGRVPEGADVAAARQAVEANPDLQVALDSNGDAPVTMTAREALEMADRDLAQAETDATAIEAAVACFLRTA
jgi:hypothetical protein